MTNSPWSYPDGPTVPAPIVEVQDGRAMIVRPNSFARGYISHPHRHRYGQLIHAISGMLVVRSPHGSWIVPSGRGVWVPPLAEHSVDMLTDVEMRSAYLDENLSGRIKGGCRVIGIANLLRELVLYVVDREAGSSPELGGSVSLLVVELINEASVSPLEIPIPANHGLQRIYRELLNDPSDDRTLTAWARHTGSTERTLVRRLKVETGMTFRIWRQQIRLLSSLERLARGEAVSNVALDVGYRAPSAFITAFRRSFGKTPASYFKEARLPEQD
jgi:AraC-like DNA-binding protein